MIKILFFGDIMGKIGRKGLAAVLPELKRQYKPDLTIANAENLAHGAGASRKTLEEMRQAGVDCFTSGNHIWDKSGIDEVFLSADITVLRPANYPQGVKGKGEAIVEASGKMVLVVNLMGRVFFKENLDCPFRTMDKILKQYEGENLQAIVVDFHAEATSEKTAFGHYLDGRVSAVFGTHTQVPTADEQILPKGTGYITDAGMSGAKDSVIGVAKEGPLAQFLTQTPQRFEIPEQGICSINGVLVQVDEKTRKATSIERVYREVVI